MITMIISCDSTTVPWWALIVEIAGGVLVLTGIGILLYKIFDHYS